MIRCDVPGCGKECKTAQGLAGHKQIVHGIVGRSLAGEPAGAGGSALERIRGESNVAGGAGIGALERIRRQPPSALERMRISYMAELLPAAMAELLPGQRYDLLKMLEQLTINREKKQPGQLEQWISDRKVEKKLS